MKILILSSSLNPRGKSHTLCLRAQEILEEIAVDTALVELGELDLPLCGGLGSFENTQALELTERVREADAVLIGSPVYNYDVNAACKNAIELTGEGWEDKIVGFLCVAGGHAGYMSVMGLANSLMLDFRCVVVPRFVYATGAAFKDGALVDVEIDRRVRELCVELSRFARGLGGAG